MLHKLKASREYEVIIEYKINPNVAIILQLPTYSTPNPLPTP